MTRESVRLAHWCVRVASGLVILAATAIVTLGLGLIAEDASQRGEMFDGLGIFVGLAICGGGVVCLAVGGLALWWARRRTLAAAMVLCAFGALVAASGYSLVASNGTTIAAATIVGGLVVSGLGLAAALLPSVMTIDSRSGISR